MEQRNSERKTVSMDAVVACTRFGLIRGRITDMTTGGLYIRADTSIVPLGSDVTVTFQPGVEMDHACLTFKGRVSHQSLHGFGVEFEQVAEECASMLESMLLDLPLAPQRAVPALRAI